MKTICPYCKYKANKHEALEEKNNPSPLEGDVSVCINCGEISEFNSGYLIKVDFKSLDEKTKKDVKKIKKAWLQTRHLTTSKGRV